MNFLEDQYHAKTTLKTLATVLGFIILPHVFHFPIWISLTFYGLLFWFVLGFYYPKCLPNKFVLISLFFVLVIACVATFGRITGKEAGSALFTILLGLKLLETHSPRDAYIVLYLSYFAILTHFLFSQTILISIYSLILIILLSNNLLILVNPIRQGQYLQYIKRTIVLLLQALPMTLLLFLLFPRASSPLVGYTDSATAMTGLSDTMSPGKISHLSQSEAIAFRATFEQAIPPVEQLYWRGPVLWKFDGITWRRGLSSFSNKREDGEYWLAQKSQPIRHSITLEPHNKPWLFALDLPTKSDQFGQINPSFELLAPLNVKNRIQYTATSYQQYNTGKLSYQDRKQGLQLPYQISARVIRLAQQWQQQSSSDSEVVDKALDFFNKQKFIYTLNPPKLGKDPVDGFLFETRQGFCEHYASAFVVLMRLANIPARIVTGYQGGEINPISDYVIVRQSAAHAWAEVWLPKRGWVRVDPTAVIAPERVHQSIDLNSQGLGSPIQFQLPQSQQILTWNKELIYYWDALNNEWNDTVLGFSRVEQTSLLEYLGFKKVTAKKLLVLVILLMAILFIVTMLILLRHRSPTIDKVQQIYLSFCQKLNKRYKIQRQSWEGPIDFSLRIKQQQPQLSVIVNKITQLYLQLRYSPHYSKQGLQQFKQIVKKF